MKDKFYLNYKKLALSIALFRKERGITQLQLANKMGVNIETISRIENANTGLSMDMLFELAKALEISLTELFAHAKL